MTLIIHIFIFNSIYKKIIYCNDNRKKVLKLYDEFSVKNLNSGKELVKRYIELGDNSD